MFSSSSSTPKKSAGDAAALKVRSVSLVTLEVYSTDLYKLKNQLEAKAKQGQDFFRNSPLLVNLQHLEDEVDIYWLNTIIALVKKYSFLPVGVTGGPEALSQAALNEGIPVWPANKNEKSTPVEEFTAPAEEPVQEEIIIEEPVQEQAPEPEPEPVQEAIQEAVEEKAAAPEKAEENTPPVAQYVPTKMVMQPVRSGQRIYAKGGDLIVMAAVNTGAEVMADGNIHIYGTLRGRALAGVAGWEGARIFCQDLRADLVAIAGYYTINEDLPQDKINKAVQISLEKESLNVDLLAP